MGADKKKLSYNFQVLKQRIERGFGYEGIEHFVVRTDEGNGPLHVVSAWTARRRYRKRSFYIPQSWISENWNELNGAAVVWIKRIRNGYGSVKKLSRYVIAQYVSDQVGYRRMSWSWKRSFGFPLVKVWSWIKSIWDGRRRKEMIWCWHWLMSGKGWQIGQYWVTIEWLRELYQCENPTPEYIHAARVYGFMDKFFRVIF